MQQHMLITVKDIDSPLVGEKIGIAFHMRVSSWIAEVLSVFREEHLNEKRAESSQVQVEGLQSSTSFPVSFPQLTDPAEMDTHYSY